MQMINRMWFNEKTSYQMLTILRNVVLIRLRFIIYDKLFNNHIKYFIVTMKFILKSLFVVNIL